MTGLDATPPTLAVVSGAPGTGKTTLAHELARIIGCAAIIRDEIKQGMVLASPGHRPREADPLDRRALETFFDVLRVLLRSGATVIAEAAFQDRLWRPGLEPLTALARIRVIRCTAPAAIADDRIIRRARRDACRAAHADHLLIERRRTGTHPHDAFVPISLDVPTMVVDTTDGHHPDLTEIAAFLRRP